MKTFPSFLTLVLIITSTNLFAVNNCPPGQFQGAITTSTTTYTPIAVQPWIQGVGTWSRAITCATTETISIRIKCYTKKIWAILDVRGTVIDSLTLTIPGNNIVRIETMYLCVLTPGSGIPPPFNESERHTDYDFSPSASPPSPAPAPWFQFPTTVGYIGEHDSLSNFTFQEVLTDYGSHFITGGNYFISFAQTAAGFHEPGLGQPDTVLNQLGIAMQNAGSELANGSPANPAPFLQVASSLQSFIQYPDLTADPLYVAAFPHLLDAASQMQTLAGIISGGFPNDTMKIRFINGIEMFRQDLMEFSNQVSQINPPVSIPAMSVLGKFIFGILILTAGLIFIFGNNAGFRT